MIRSTHTAEGRLVIDLHDLHDAGRLVTGQIDADIFQLEAPGPQPIGPLTYRLHIERRGGWLVASGTVGSDFELECSRCLERFRERITLDGYMLEEEVGEKTSSVDLTERIREDILLALPGYPHCDESNLAPRTCPAADRFLPTSSYSPAHPEDVEKPVIPEIWGALDQLEIKPSQAPQKPKQP